MARAARDSASADSAAKGLRPPDSRGRRRASAPGPGAAPPQGAAEPAARLSPGVLSGVGPRRLELLARAGILSLADLALFAPRGAAIFPKAQPIASLELAAAPSGKTSASAAPRRIRGRVVKLSFSRFGRRSLLRVGVDDGSGQIDVLFFNQAWLRGRFQIGESIDVLGRAVDAKGRGFQCLRLGSEARPLPAAGTLAVEYPSLGGLSPEFLADLCRRALERIGDQFRDPLPPEWLAAHDLPDLRACARGLHGPADEAEFGRALRRRALERSLVVQARIAARRAARLERQATRIRCTDAEERVVLAQFPFVFTAGQLKVAADLRDDLARSVPMRRLLQGDVGSGKTALGLYACLLAARAGVQSAFMAPTELLAEQHILGQEELCLGAGLRVARLTGSLSQARRREVEAGLADGSIDLVFGTHALFSESVRFKRLGLAVIDEQHRFGVEQRQRLAGKGRDVHVLLMTATPIPRSLALSVYGDLDLSVLRERPPGRGPMETLWVRKEHKAQALARISGALERGERVYWVVPRIGAAEAEGPQEPPAALGASAEARFAKLSRSTFARYGIELVHGRLDPEERSQRLERFRSGEARLLVATTVIEVGVDVPEATVMVIEGAERLGLAQLHQLRGRVGRGPQPSVCLLYGKPVAAERMALLERLQDGFRIAEQDLLLRGMGELAGLRQAGASDLAAQGALSPEESLRLARELFHSNPTLAFEYHVAGATFDS